MPKPIDVLLVEDQAGDILLVRQALAKESTQINLHIAVDGLQAIQMLAERQFTPDVIILDLNLPKLSGMSFLQQSHPKIPVVVFTSSSNPRERDRALALGAREWAQKPSDIEVYIHVVLQMIRNWGMAAFGKYPWPTSAFYFGPP